jgi:hypothetical protein
MPNEKRPRKLHIVGDDETPQRRAPLDAHLVALHDYELMGSERSLKILSMRYIREASENKPIPTKQLSTLKKWSVVYGWYTLCADFDAEKRRVELRAELDAAAAEAGQRKVDRLNLAKLARKKAFDALKMVSIEALSLRPDRIVAMLMYADRTERLDYGDTSAQEAGIARTDVGPMSVQNGHDLSGYTIEELEAIERIEHAMEARRRLQ